MATNDVCPHCGLKFAIVVKKPRHVVFAAGNFAGEVLTGEKLESYEYSGYTPIVSPSGEVFSIDGSLLVASITGGGSFLTSIALGGLILNLDWPVSICVGTIGFLIGWGYSLLFQAGKFSLGLGNSTEEIEEDEFPQDVTIDNKTMLMFHWPEISRRELLAFVGTAYKAFKSKGHFSEKDVTSANPNIGTTRYDSIKKELSNLGYLQTDGNKGTIITEYGIKAFEELLRVKT